jgi:dynein heavy chain
MYWLDEFYTMQKSNISNITAFLTQKWVIDIEETVKDLVGSQGDKWDCVESRTAYESSKLKSFLTVVKYMMQDSLNKIASRSIKHFVDAVKIKMPDKVILHASNHVEN